MNKVLLPSDQDLVRLGQECLLHLEREESALRGFLQHALDVQEAVVNGSDADPAETQQKQDQLNQDAQALALARSELKLNIAKAFGKPIETVSIKLLAKQLDQRLADRIMDSRQRILDLTQSIEAANRTNFLLIQQTIDLQQRLQLAITGQAPTARTYGATGQLNRQADNAMLETEC